METINKELKRLKGFHQKGKLNETQKDILSSLLELKREIQDKELTKDRFLREADEIEIWGLVENFLNYWKEELILQGFKEDEIKQIPTDKESYEIVVQMKKVIN